VVAAAPRETKCEHKLLSRMGTLDINPGGVSNNARYFTGTHKPGRNALFHPGLWPQYIQCYVQILQCGLNQSACSMSKVQHFTGICVCIG
jgi:hypothetical protein